MERASLPICSLALVAILSNPATASEDPSFESQVLHGHKAIVSMALASGKAKTSVEMRMDWDEHGSLAITESNLNLYIFGDYNLKENVIYFDFSGGLEVTAKPIHPTHSSMGYAFKGPGMDFKIEQVGRLLYFINGKYKNGSDKHEQLDLSLEPTNDGWDISADGMHLLIKERRHSSGAEITGWINQAEISKTRMGIIGACVAAITYIPSSASARFRSLGQHAGATADHPAPVASLGLPFRPSRPADAGR